MAAKRRARRKVVLMTGPRGSRGKAGRVGPAGPPGKANGEMARLAAQMNEVLRELQTQLMRIAQLQLQLDRLAAGQSPLPARAQRKRTTEH